MTLSIDYFSPDYSGDFIAAMARSARQRGEEHRDAGRLKEALAAFDEALGLCPDDSATLIGRCRMLQKTGRQEEALAGIWRLLGDGHNSPAVWQEAGSALLTLNRTSEARAALRNVLLRDPHVGHAWGLLGEVLAKQGKESAAEICFRRNAALAPDDALVRLRLGQWLMQAADYQGAIEFFSEARRLDPLSLDALSGLAQTYISLGRFEEAEPLLHQVIEKNADHLDARLGLARLCLLKGDFAAGWPAYEWRRRRADLKLPKFSGPEWDGSPLCGKTLLVYAEQGFGDVIQFLRYVPLLFAEGARVILLIPKELERLCQCLADVAEIRCNFRSLPAFDFHIPLLSVALHLETRRETIPAGIPYLSTPPSVKPKLPVPLGTRLKVGLVWAGRPTHANDRHRSVGLKALLPLAAVPGVTVYSLQAGPRAADIHKAAHPVLVGDLSPHLKDFVDTAAVIEQLDLVIAVDTSVAHLAGALGKPVWVLVPFAPDWRWMQKGEDSPWYPSMRLFRQPASLAWDGVIEQMSADLGRWAAANDETGVTGDCIVHSVFAGQDGKTRYIMPVPREYLTDPGLNYLAHRERNGVGYEYATRCFLDAHLRPGDLFIDVGAHWGIMSLHAATRWPGQVQVIACEPTPRNVPQLRRWIDENRLSDVIDVVPEAIADLRGHGIMLPQSTMGHSLQKSDAGAIPVTTIDDLLDERPHLAGRRVIVKIDVEGSEGDVITGMARLLAGGTVAAIIWERGRTYDQMPEGEGVAAIRSGLAKLGFTAWRFDSEDAAGVLQPFVDGRVENVFELAATDRPFPSYGATRLGKDRQPVDPQFDLAERAADFFGKGLKFQSSGETDKALSAYAHAGTYDRRSPDLFNNLGVALQRLGRFDAAEVAYRRSLALVSDNPSCLSNLGSLLREMGKLEDAVKAHVAAVALAPASESILVNAGHAFRDIGRYGPARSFYEKALTVRPGYVEAARDHAELLLWQGDFEKGARALEPFQNSPAASDPAGRQWQGESLKGQSIVLLDDAALEDVLLYARFIPTLAGGKGAKKIVVHCRPSVARLLATLPGVDDVVPRDGDIPECDYHLSLRALPAALRIDRKLFLAKVPYWHPRPAEISPHGDGRLKVGVAWSSYPSRAGSSCPLSSLAPLLFHPEIAVVSLQQGTAAGDLQSMGLDAVAEDFGPRLVDLAEMAAVMRSLDLVITVDGAVAHVAGGLGVPAFVLLPFTADWRWAGAGETSLWYSSVRLFRQSRPNDWTQVLADVGHELDQRISREADEPSMSPSKSREIVAAGAPISS
ncbi:FkbM family methyltransferase [Telmatospirillum sp.]|uniref:FkbM family methyltransferase n=1 Tax=Telmatospirillum sp. TaxID=2079197 RepID=UPI00284EDE0C|nr:FkbM family methyltransferase [Telmatospirillum sp.]MDR3440669.1 FkbM family methyltransferase [Telmatospirillum sp.]